MKDNEEFIEGLSGRKLKITGLNNPTGKYHVGMKSAYELYPRELVERIQKEKKKEFDKVHQSQINSLYAKSQKLESGKKEKKDVDLQIEQLNEMAKEYADIVILDCVVFHDGKVWRAVVDTKETGDLASYPALTDFDVEYQKATFSAQDLLHFGVHIYNDGSI